MAATATATKTMYREHPLKILRYSAKNLWLLIFPLLRSLRFYPFSIQNLLDWGAGVWLDLLIALLILGIGVLRWLTCIYYFDSVSIRSHKGILIQQTTEVPLKKITATIEEHPLYLRPFHAANLQISTAAGILPEASMQLLLQESDLHKLRQHIPVLKTDGGKGTVYRTPTIAVLLFSALFSSSLSGAVYLTTLFIQGGRVLSDLYNQFQGGQLLEDVTDRASSMVLLRRVPKLAITIGIIILFLWLLSFCRNLLRYSRFRIRFGEEFFSVHMGLITRRRVHLREKAIVFPDLRQNLIMKLCGMVSLHIRCPGYGGRHDDLPVLLPLLRKKTAAPLLEKLHAMPKLAHPTFRTLSRPKFFWSFVWQPVLGLCAILPARGFLLLLLPRFESAIRFFSFMLLIPLLWLLVVRVVSLFTESLAMEGETLQMHFSSGFFFHTITVDTSKIVRAEILQNPFQKQYKVCHLYLVCNGARQKRYKLTALPEKAARRVVERVHSLSQ